MLTETLTETQLKAIEARANLATPGDWCVWSEESEDGPDGIQYSVCSITQKGNHNYSEDDERRCIATVMKQGNNNYNNAEFITNAKIDIYALITEVKRLQFILNSITQYGLIK